MSLEKTFDENQDAPLNITRLLGNNDLLRLTSASRMFKNWGHIDGVSLRRNTQKQMVKISLAKERIALEYNPSLPNLFPDPVYPHLSHSQAIPTEKQMNDRNKLIVSMGGMGTIFPRGEAEYRGFMGYPVGGVLGGDDQDSDD